MEQKDRSESDAVGAPAVSAFKSPWVLGWIGMIAVVFAVNITMAVIAVRTSPGLVVDDYYEKGKNYKAAIEKQGREKALGWKAEIAPEGEPVAGRTSKVSVTVVDAAGSPVEADRVELFAYRPSDVRADFSAPLAALGGGRYGGEMVFPLPGVWDVVVSLERGGDRFEEVKRLFAAKPS